MDSKLFHAELGRDFYRVGESVLDPSFATLSNLGLGEGNPLSEPSVRSSSNVNLQDIVNARSRELELPDLRSFGSRVLAT